MLLAALIISASLTYPITSLGDCDSLSSCRTYCEIPWHQTVCTDYGVEQGWVKKPQVLAAVSVAYPVSELGNCGSKLACKRYCDLPANKTACLNFARAHGIRRAPSNRPGGNLTGLTFPIAELGGCASVRACKVYCDQPQNRQACFDFAYGTGLIGGKKAAEKLSGLKFPIAELGNCGSMSECDAYCSQPDHMQTCNAYAEKIGFEPGGPAGMNGPGGCTTPEECNAYCSQPANQNECTAAWEEHCGPNPNKPECQKPPGGGPGGCTSDEECRRGREEWCRKNPEECQRSGEGGPDQCGGQECGQFCQQNPNDDYCVRKEAEFCQSYPEKCAQQGSGGSFGPGGCETQEECAVYCQSHLSDPECQGGSPSGETGPLQ